MLPTNRTTHGLRPRRARAGTWLLALTLIAPVARAQAPATAEAPAGTTATEPKPWKRFELASQDGAHRLELRALIHADARFFLRGDARDTFALRRVRPSLDAVVFRYYELKLQPDFAGSRVQLLDAFGNLHFFDEIQLRVGKGKAPVGLERLQSPSDITFAERAFPTSLVPNRDVGAQLHGVLLDGAVEWAAGVYNGVANGQSGDLDENDAKDVVGRVFVAPFRALAIEPLAGLGLGIAATHGEQAGALPEYRTAGQVPFLQFAETSVASGERTVLAPQGHYYFGPVGLLGEYVHVSERVANDVGASARLTHRAWQVAGSVVLGGRPSYKGVKVDTTFDPQRGGLGALELSARYTAIDLDDDALAGFADPASAQGARAWAVGSTWHFATRVRALVNYERTTFDDRAPADRDAEELLVSRLQLAF